ncbi:serine incorporator 5 [Eurytemora carolleeae]|uniref:serine incorporator 5 n=1 Tax=Eurytemora carolleeae TaxID=1294199 RepID=UPI000C76676F|nr:serine incorporator 5 [Eurytemora carolleeae]|eukprot:XP_023331453.1 serine incorporator 5-like [Eurytemora affinis]
MVQNEDGFVYKVRSCIGGQIGWLLGHRAPRLCYSSLPPIAESTATRLMYLLLLGVGSTGMALMLTQRMQHDLQAAFKDFNATCIDLDIGDNCMKLTGYMALYKVSFGISVFFCFLAFLNIGVTSSVGLRAATHNGFWVWKVLLLILLCVTTFVVPVPHLDSFHTGWLYCALGGACIFLLVQVIRDKLGQVFLIVLE